MKNKTLLADLSLLLVSIIWGAGFVAVKEALNVAQPFYLMSIRFFMSFAIMALFFCKKMKRISKKDIKNGFIVGLFLFLTFGTQTVGLLFTTASKQAFLTGTNVVFVPFILWAIFKKKPDIYSLTSAFLCVLGIALLTLQDSIYINLGDALTLICAVFFAFQIVAIGHYTKETDPIILTIIQLGVCGLLSIVVALIFETPPTQYTTAGAVSILYLGTISTFVAFSIQSVAQKHTTSTHAAIILCTQAVFGSVLSVILLNEPFTIAMTMGCIIIFMSIIISETKLDFLKKKVPVTSKEKNLNINVTETNIY